MTERKETQTIIEVYDPAMCCSTGVCGPDVDDEIVDFANDVKWLKTQGVEVKRYNLGQEPEQFKMCVPVLTRLQKEGADVLPIILVNGEMVSEGRYPDRKQLTDWLDFNAEKTNDEAPTSKLLNALEVAVTNGNEKNMRALFEEGIAKGAAIQKLVDAMQNGINNRQQVTQTTVQTANELLGVPSNGCAPGSGCC